MNAAARLFFSLALGCGFALAQAAPAQAPLPKKTSSADFFASTNRVIVKFKDSELKRALVGSEAFSKDPMAVHRARVASLAQRTGLSLKLVRSVTPAMHSVRLDKTLRGAALDAVVAKLAADPAIAVATPDRRKRAALVPNDTAYGFGQLSKQWYLPAPTIVSATQDYSSAIDAEHAWNLTTGSSNIVVAVLDTGALYDHPDMAQKFLPGYDFIGEDLGPGNQTLGTFLIANDSDGADSDASDPGDWVSAADLTDPVFDGCAVSNSSWHGTRVAGIIGAKSNNGLGITGIAWQTPILPVRVLGKCAGFDADILAGIRWATGQPVPGIPTNQTPARVVNLSLGGSGACRVGVGLYDQAIADANSVGAVVVIAAGNESGPVAEPANCPGAISVGALRSNGEKVGFSNFGPEVTLSAPGGNCAFPDGSVDPSNRCLYPIVATANSGTTIPDPNTTTGMVYEGELGTSFSAPMVSGVAALMLSANPALSAADVRNGLIASAKPFRTTSNQACNVATAGDPCSCTTATCGAGMLNAFAATSYAVNPPPPPAPPAGDSGGGGALGWGVLVALAVAARRRHAV